MNNQVLYTFWLKFLAYVLINTTLCRDGDLLALIRLLNDCLPLGMTPRSGKDWYFRWYAHGDWFRNFAKFERDHCFSCKSHKFAARHGDVLPPAPSQHVPPVRQPPSAADGTRKRDDCKEGDGFAKLASEIRLLKTMDGADDLLQLKQQQYDKLVSERQAAKPIDAQRQKIVYSINDPEKSIRRHQSDMEALEKEAAKIAIQIAEKSKALVCAKGKLAKARMDLTELDAIRPEGPTLAAGHLEVDKLFDLFKHCFPSAAAAAAEGDQAVFQTKLEEFVASSVPASQVKENVADVTAPAENLADIFNEFAEGVMADWISQPDKRKEIIAAAVAKKRSGRRSRQVQQR